MMLNIVFLLCSASFLYGVALVCYRLVLSPLARFPGSKLAAAKLWYEFDYEVIQRGQFTFKVREWHEKYGKLFPS
jgi:hypothetical protein